MQHYNTKTHDGACGSEKTLKVSESPLGTEQQQSDFLVQLAARNQVVFVITRLRKWPRVVPRPIKVGFVAAVALADGISDATDFHRDVIALLRSLATERREILCCRAVRNRKCSA